MKKIEFEIKSLDDALNFAAKEGYWSAPKETMKMFNAIFTYIFI